MQCSLTGLKAKNNKKDIIGIYQPVSFTFRKNNQKKSLVLNNPIMVLIIVPYADLSIQIQPKYEAIAAC